MILQLKIIKWLNFVHIFSDHNIAMKGGGGTFEDEILMDLHALRFS